MANKVTGYDGAVNGLQILHGVALAQPHGTEATGSRDLPDDVEIDEAIHRAIEVIGSREEAMRWLGTPVRALDFATPISLLHDPTGREQVLSVLLRLEHGVL
ncbi:MAG TPA: MbcA/ParS/Xre antitoxin family protein [Bryobacteraceae bacterium]|jgi:hypothetical protein